MRYCLGERAVGTFKQASPVPLKPLLFINNSEGASQLIMGSLRGRVPSTNNCSFTAKFLKDYSSSFLFLNTNIAPPATIAVTPIAAKALVQPEPPV